MELLKKILKDKLFYILLLLVVVINTAMRINDSNNPDLLKEYYEASLIPDTVGGDPEVMFNTPAIRDSIITFALTLQGIPYKYAGKGPNVFDCSGFTSYVFKNFDIQIPASSMLQSQYGEGIDNKEIKKGDLLYFKSPTKGVNRVGHVGIVVSNDEGKIDFIHSSTHRGVVIDSLSNRYYNARYMGARKVLEL